MRTARILLLAAVSGLLLVGVLPVAAPAAAFHVCVQEPCGGHGTIDDVKPLFILLCKVSNGAWSPNCP